MSPMVVSGVGLYLRSKHPQPVLGSVAAHEVTRDAVAFAGRCKRLGVSWVAIGGPWQDGPGQTRWLNSPAACLAYREALRDAGIDRYVWGYPWLGGEQEFVTRMVDCAGDDAQHLLDPELGMNPTRSKNMLASNASAAAIVAGLRTQGARRIGLSTFGGIPSWFPLRAFLRAGVDFAGGQTYTEDPAIDTSIATFVAEMKLCGSGAQLVPNFGLYARNPDGSARSKTPEEFRAHLDEFINEGEPVHAVIGWAENFLTTALEHELAEFSRRLSAYRGA